MMKTHSKKSSRTIKRAFAVVMSFALAMSTLTVAPDAAAAKKAVPKLSVKKKTLYYNKAGKKTYTLKVNKNKVKKITKTTWKTSKKSVVAISKKTKTSVKLTAKKAGTAKITAVVKYTVKGSKKVKSKKLTFTATSKKAKVATATPKPTATATATATAAPTATATATAEPTATATATAEPSQTPIVGDVAKVEAIITNSVMGHENTVLAGQDATVQVLVTDSKGNPVANDNVVIAVEPDGKATAATDTYRVQGMRVATTNSKGIATFVIGTNDANVENTNQNYVGAYDFKVTDASENISATGKLKVAAISYVSKKKNIGKAPNGPDANWADQTGNVLCLNGAQGTDYAALVVGPTSKKLGNADGRTSTTTNMNGEDVQYVGSQQVSATGADHKVAFKTGVSLVLPNEGKEATSTTHHVQTINKQSGNYHLYNDKYEYLNFDITDLENVEYATLAFNSLTLSKYTQLEVGTFKVVNGQNTPDAAFKTYGSNDNTYNNKNFGLQIEKNQLKGKSGIYLRLRSAGQVDTDNNVGYDVKDLTYVYKAQGTVYATPVALESVSVKWETVTPVYEDEVKVDAAIENKVKAIVGDAAFASYETITAKVPVFPYVGNAIVKCYDKNRNVKKYFACNTVRNANKNVNILNADSDFYEITEAEATNSVGTLTEKDGIAEVDSTATGTTFLKGTITCTDKNVKLDAKCDTVYTSIMWNPIEDSKAADKRDAFMALEGQSITVKAQLVDMNGNAVAKSGLAIDWKQDTAPLGDPAGIAKIQADSATDAKGQATLQVSAGEAPKKLCRISAKNSSDQYRVVLKIGDKTVEKADLYWISVGLAFVDKIDGTTYKSFDSDLSKRFAEVKAEVGESWEYATRVVLKGNDPAYEGDLDGYAIDNISGVIPSLKKHTDSDGTVTCDTDTAIAKVTSKAAGTGAFEFRIDANTKFDKAQVCLKRQYKPDVTVQLVGEGKPAIRQVFDVYYSFAVNDNVDFSLDFFSPMGTLSTTEDKDVYVKVTDKFGNAKKDATVKFTTASTAATLKTTEVKTDENGIAKNQIILSDEVNGQNVGVKAEIKNSSVVAYETFLFDKDATKFRVETNGVAFDGEKTITLTLEAGEILSDSVKKDIFTVTKNTTNCTIKSVVAKDRTITITLNAKVTLEAADELKVKIADGEEVDGVMYYITSTTGKHIVAETVVINGNGEVKVNAADAEAAVAFNSTYGNPTTYDEVKKAKKAFDALSAGAQTESGKKDTLDDLCEEVAKIDASVNQLKGKVYKKSVQTWSTWDDVETTLATVGDAGTNNVTIGVKEKATLPYDTTTGSVVCTVTSNTTDTLKAEVSIVLQ